MVEVKLILYLSNNLMGVLPVQKSPNLALIENEMLHLIWAWRGRLKIMQRVLKLSACHMEKNVCLKYVAVKFIMRFQFGDFRQLFFSRRSGPHQARRLILI